ncbi:hypothetical protein FKM82_017465 [Ascaphus truei]
MSSRKQSLLSRAESSSQQRLPHMQQLGGAGRVRQDPPSASFSGCICDGTLVTSSVGDCIPELHIQRGRERSETEANTLPADLQTVTPHTG